MRFDIHTGKWFGTDFCENFSSKVNSQIFEVINKYELTWLLFLGKILMRTDPSSARHFSTILH